MPLPLVISVTGHRRPAPEAEPVLRAAVARELRRLQNDCPHTPLLLLTGLAEGADTLCAEEALRLGIPFRAVLPCEEELFLEDFSGSAREHCRELLGQAEQVVTAPSVEPPEESRRYRFRQVGIYLVEHAQVLLALWDGGSPVPGGCGTAEVVDMLRSGSYVPAGGTSLRSPDNTVLLTIRTPRAGSPSEEAGEVHREGNERVLSELETCNSLLSASEKPDFPLLPPP